MSDTTFVNGTTLTDADWFNDVNRLHYTILSDPADVAAVKTALAIAAAAAQSDQETGTSTTTYVSPGRQQFHPSADKAWGYVTYSGGAPTLAANYNCTGVVDNSIGDITFFMDTDMSSVNYATGAIAHSPGTAHITNIYGIGTAGFRVLVFDAAGTPADPAAVSAWAKGDQA